MRHFCKEARKLNASYFSKFSTVTVASRTSIRKNIGAIMISRKYVIAETISAMLLAFVFVKKQGAGEHS
jgi:hypothetical protein